MIWPWTDGHGTVHVRIPRTDETECGLNAELHTQTRPQQACDDCVRKSTLRAVNAQYDRQPAHTLTGPPIPIPTTIECQGTGIGGHPGSEDR